MWVHEKPIICRPPPFPSETHNNSQVWFSHNVTFWYSPPPRFVYCGVNSFRRGDEWLLSFLLGVNGKWDAACLIEIFILGLNISNLQRFPLLRCIFNHEKMPVRMPSQFFFLSVLQESTHTNKYKAKEIKFETQLHVQANLTTPHPMFTFALHPDASVLTRLLQPSNIPGLLLKTHPFLHFCSFYT